MTWEVIYDTYTYIPLDVSITKKLDGLNNATIQLKEDIPLNSTVTVKYNGSTMFVGVVTGVIQDEYGLKTYNLVETAIELDHMVVESDGKYTFTITDQSVDDIVDLILADSGWTRQSSDTTTIPAVSFSYATKLQALYRVITNHLGKHVWFDNENKYVYFGSQRVDRGSITYLSKQVEESNEKRQVNKVIVFSNDESVYGVYDDGGGNKTVVYKYADARTQEECESIAEKIYNELQNNYKRTTIQTPIQQIDEGDLVTVDGTSYLVHQVDINTYDMTLHLNNPKKSLFDVIGSKLTEMTGTVRTGKLVTVNYDGGWQNVDLGVNGVWNVYIDDLDLVKEFTLTVQTDKFRYFSDVKSYTYSESIDGYTLDNLPFVGEYSNFYSDFPTDIDLPANVRVVVCDDWCPVHTFMVLVVGSFIIEDENLAGTIGMSVYDADTDEMFPSQDYNQWSWATKNPDGYLAATCVVAIPGDRYHHTLETCVQYPNDATLKSYEVVYYYMATHDHDFDESSTEHDHYVKHSHGIYEWENYPYNAKLYVNGSEVGSIPNADKSITVVFNIPKEYLQNGTNKIEVSSESHGLIRLSGVIKKYVLS